MKDTVRLLSLAKEKKGVPLKCFGRLRLFDTPLYLIALKTVLEICAFHLPNSYIFVKFFLFFVLFFHLICQNNGLGDIPHGPARIHTFLPDSAKGLVLQKAVLPH